MDGFLLLLLEAAVALALLIFIVWWTWPRSKPSNASDADKTPHRQGRKENQ